MNKVVYKQNAGTGVEYVYLNGKYISHGPLSHTMAVNIAQALKVAVEQEVVYPESGQCPEGKDDGES